MTASGAGVTVGVRFSGVMVRLFEACSFLAAARAGSFLFLSIVGEQLRLGSCVRGSLCRGCYGLSDYCDGIYERCTMVMMAVGKMR